MSAVIEFIKESAHSLALVSRLQKIGELKLENANQFSNALYHYNSNYSFSVLHLCNRSQELFKHEYTQYFNKNSNEFVNHIYGAFTNEFILPSVVKYCSNRRKIGQSTAYFSEMLTPEHKSFKWFITVTYVHNQHINLNYTIALNQIDEQFSRQFEKIDFKNFFSSYADFQLLTKKESAIIDKLLAGQTREHIAAQMRTTTSTYDSHVKNIKRKLRVDSLNEALLLNNSMKL
ncbi:MAG: LuxR C-terminal-related transcriptional regulator [Bacteroidia bacterium]